MFFIQQQKYPFFAIFRSKFCIFCDFSRSFCIKNEKYLCSMHNKDVVYFPRVYVVAWASRKHVWSVKDIVRPVARTLIRYLARFLEWEERKENPFWRVKMRLCTSYTYKPYIYTSVCNIATSIYICVKYGIKRPADICSQKGYYASTFPEDQTGFFSCNNR